MRHLFLAFIGWTALLASAGSFAQGFQWSYPYKVLNYTICRDQNGDVYVITLDGFIGGSVIAFDRYTANGVLLSHDAFATPTRSSEFAFAEVRDGVVHFMTRTTAAGRTVQVPMYKGTFEASTHQFTSFLLESSGSDVIAWSGAMGPTTYALNGYRKTDDVTIVQVRSLANNAKLYEYQTDARGEVVATGFDSYAEAAFKFENGNSSLIVRPFSASSGFTSYVAAAPVGTVDARLLVTTTNTGRYLYVVGNYANDSAIYIRGFDLSAKLFTNPLDVAAGDRVVSLGRWLDESCMLVGDKRLLGFNPGVANVFAQTLAMPCTGAVQTSDNFFNSVVWMNVGRDFILQRLDSNGILNSITFANADATPTRITLDPAGTVRGMYFRYRTALEKEHFVAALVPALLVSPGTFTVGGASRQATINIGDPAPASGVTFDLFSSSPSATVPPIVTIPSGESSVSFAIATTPVTANEKPAINARFKGIVLQTTFDLAAPLIKSITASPQSQFGGNNIVATVRLTGKAPVGGKVVSLSSSNPSKASVPSSTTLVAGSDGKTFLVTTFPTLANASAVITATTGAVSKTVFVAVLAPIFQSATLGSGSVQGGTSTTMALTIGSKAPSGYTINLLSGSPSFVVLPSSFAIPVNGTSASVPVLTNSVTASMPVTLVAYRGPYIKTMTLTLTP